MGMDDAHRAHRAWRHTDTDHDPQGLGRGIAAGVAQIPKRAKDQSELDREPYPRQKPEPEQVRLRRVRVPVAQCGPVQCPAMTSAARHTRG